MIEALNNSVIPQNDAQRLEALHRYKILGSPPEEAFNNIARIMADFFEVPIALISLVDKEKVFFKGNVGMPGVKFTDRQISLCSFAILSPEPTVFDNPLDEPCLLANPLVHGSFGLRFYAGAPLTTYDGFNIGSVCILDKKERSFSPQQQDALVRFSKVVMHQIELRQAVIKQAEAEQQLTAANHELQFVTDTMPQMVWATEANGYAYFFNKGWLAYTGLTLDEVKGNGWVQSVHPEDMDLVLDSWYTAVKTGERYEVEYRIRRYDGVYRWFLGRSTPMKNEQGVILKWYGTKTDIHDQKLAEEALVQSKERFELVAKATQDAIWDWDLRTNAIWWNEGYKSLFGYTDEDIKPGIDSWYSNVHPDDKERVIGGIHQIIDNGGKHWSEEYRFRRKDGSFATVFDRGYALHDADGQPFRMLGSMQDISERKLAEAVLQKSKEHQSFQLQLSDQLRPLTDPDEIQLKAASILGTYLGASRVGYAQDQGNGQSIEIRRNYTLDVPGMEGIHNYNDYDPTLLSQLQAGNTIIRNDIANDRTLTDQERAAHAALQIGALANIPLVKGGKLLLVLFVHFKEAHQWSPEELMLLEETAERTWAVAERALAEQALRKSEERLQKAVSIETVGVLYFDLEGRINEANIAFQHMSGYSREDISSGKISLEVLTPPEFMDATLYAQQEFITKWQNTPYEKQLIRQDGSRWWGLIAGKRLSVNECVEFIVDITQAKLAEEELEQKVKERTLELEKLNSELKRSNANLEEFAYAASHDLKEPVRKIHYFSERLLGRLEHKLEPEDAVLFRRMQQAGKRMGSLIDDLLLYSHVSRGATEKEKIELNQTVKTVLEDLELEVAERKAKVVVDKLPIITGHKRQLQQLFQNLIGNALKYSKPDTPPEINISSRIVSGLDFPNRTGSDKPYHLIEVKDNGIGFNQGDAERIFNVFTRLHGNAEYKGTGVGLSIVRKVAENHNGTIWAVSRENEGATFKMLLPVT